jgi:hypothetical protein
MKDVDLYLKVRHAVRIEGLIPLPYRPESESGSSIPSTRERLALAT